MPSSKAIPEPASSVWVQKIAFVEWSAWQRPFDNIEHCCDTCSASINQLNLFTGSDARDAQKMMRRLFVQRHPLGIEVLRQNDLIDGTPKANPLSPSRTALTKCNTENARSTISRSARISQTRCPFVFSMMAGVIHQHFCIQVSDHQIKSPLSSANGHASKCP